MNYPWLTQYPEGIPHEIDPDRYAHLADLLTHSCRQYANLIAFSSGLGADLTYAQVDEMSTNFASFLQNQAMLKPGDRIALQMPNILQYPIAIAGAIKAGLIVVNTNPLYTEREMLHQFKDSGAKAIVIVANFASKLEAILPKTQIETVVITELGDLLGFPKKLLVNTVVKYFKKMVPAYHLPESISFNKALDLGSKGTFSPPDMDREDVAFLQYTGGTTGVSKGAMLTHRNVLANVEQIYAWMKPKLKPKEEVILTPLPLYHIFSLTVNYFALFSAGMRNVLVVNPRDLPKVVADMKKYQITVMTGVNTLFNAMLNNEAFRSLDFSKFKLAVGGGMAVQTVVGKRWRELTGTGLVEGYGLTETSPVLTTNPVDGREKLGTIGLPVPSTEVKVVDEQGNDLPQGERGEIVGRGPQVMKGYWQRPDETEKVFLEGGWFRTGDIGLMESDGYFRIVDRKKDMILVSGFNVYPNEIEDVIAEHDKVLEVAAIGVPDEKSTESVKVFVVKKEDSLTAEELIAYCKREMTAYKVPRQVEFRDELPKSNVGKILRRVLKEEEQRTAGSH